MPVRVAHAERVMRGDIASEHVVQLFDTTESLAESVGAFLGDGFAAGSNLLIVARTSNVDPITRALQARGCEVASEIARGRVVLLDAAETLQLAGSGTYTTPARFERAVGATVRRLSAESPLCIYGEMVELLAERGDFDQALKLEGLWNDLGEQCSFKLLCGYASAHFGSARSESILRRICSVHSSASASSDDALGAWLIATSRA